MCENPSFCYYAKCHQQIISLTPAVPLTAPARFLAYFFSVECIFFIDADNVPVRDADVPRQQKIWRKIWRKKNTSIRLLMTNAYLILSLVIKQKLDRLWKHYRKVINPWNQSTHRPHAQNIAETCQKYFQSFIANEILSLDWHNIEKYFNYDFNFIKYLWKYINVW